MKVAIIGSRNLTVDNLQKYLPDDTTEIVSGGANGIKLTEFLPEYNKYGRGAPLKRNLQIIQYSDLVIAFWDGKSRGTEYVIKNCKTENKPVTVYLKRLNS